MRCLADDPRLTAFALGESLDDSQDLESHLETCATCQRVLRETRALHGLLDAALSAEAGPGLADAQLARIETALSKPARPRRARPDSMRRASWRVFGLAAVLFLSLGLTLFVVNIQSQRSASSEQRSIPIGDAESYYSHDSRPAATLTGPVPPPPHAQPALNAEPPLVLEPIAREGYDRIDDNPFVSTRRETLSTFSIDVDRAAYANVRRFLQSGQRPPPDAVRIEELLNNFAWNDPQPAADSEHPVEISVETARCPWQTEHRLVRIALKGREPSEQRPASNLVFLLDVSGSMNQPQKLPLLKKAFRLLVSKLDARDQVSIVVYAGASGVVLPPTSCAEPETIIAALEQLQASGSTNGGAGIEQAYALASDNFIDGGINRVILATDGDFNVGISDRGQLTRLIEDKARSGVFLSVLGFGMGNYQDATLEELSNRGNGNYAYIDSLREAYKVLGRELLGSLWTIARDVKLQVEFNPSQVAGFRLIGYENRVLAHQDFDDDSKDAGELGAGHSVIAYYQVVPAGQEVPGAVEPDSLRYGTSSPAVENPSPELLFVKLRYQQPQGSSSIKLELPVLDAGQTLEDASADFKFGCAITAFGLILRDSPYRGGANFGTVLELAREGLAFDPGGDRRAFIELVEQARTLY